MHHLRIASFIDFKDAAATTNFEISIAAFRCGYINRVALALIRGSGFLMPDFDRRELISTSGQPSASARSPLARGCRRRDNHAFTALATLVASILLNAHVRRYGPRHGFLGADIQALGFVDPDRSDRKPVPIHHLGFDELLRFLAGMERHVIEGLASSVWHRGFLDTHQAIF